MESRSWTRATSGRAPGPLEHGGPKPDGYRWPPILMQVGAFLVCDLCGGAVSPTATDDHDEWHRSMGQEWTP